MVNMVNRNYWNRTHRKASINASLQGHTDNAVIRSVSHVKARPPRCERREQFIETAEGYEQFV